MEEKSTKELKGMLEKTRPSDFKGFAAENGGSFLAEGEFHEYFIRTLREKGMSQQRLFLDADVPERYGYKILSGEKRTRQRDIILRLCYAAGMGLEEAQKALRIYGMAELYAKNERDALLISAFSNRPGSIIEVNVFLKENGFGPLRTSGVQD